MKELFLYIGAVVSAANLLWFARTAWLRKTPAQNPASWVMWTTLDVLILSATIAAGKPPWLAASYVVGAGAILGVMFARGTWKWERKEWWCAAGVAVSVAVWLRYGAGTGVIAETMAMNFAGIPILMDMWKLPERKSFALWMITAVACAITLCGSDGTFVGTFLAWSGVVFNVLLSIIVLRDKRKKESCDGCALGG